MPGTLFRVVATQIWSLNSRHEAPIRSCSELMHSVSRHDGIQIQVKSDPRDSEYYGHRLGYDNAHYYNHISWQPGEKNET